MLKVGQKLWFVPHEQRLNEFEIVVEKVGRKWAATSHQMRFDLGDPNLVADGEGYNSPGRAWLTREAWELERNRRDAWQAIRTKLNDNYRPPDAVSTDDIVRANAMLGFAPLK